MNKKLIYIFAVLVAGLFVISACQEAVGVRARNLDRGGADVPVPNQIKANSCDADSICEVNSIGSTNNLVLYSGSGYTKIGGILTISDLSNLRVELPDMEDRAYVCVDGNSVLYKSYNPCR